MWGATLTLVFIPPRKPISIHAPRVGCDCFCMVCFIDYNYFNPRTPCGVRLSPLSLSHHESQFQSTHPVWGATAFAWCASSITIISIHAPRVGCDKPAKEKTSNPDKFQSTHPVWGATYTAITLYDGKTISIHAPRVGCDSVSYYQIPLPGYFNPRTPCGVRLRCPLPSFATSLLFQSTHPVWGATLSSNMSPVSPSNFNPRTPCGVRLIINNI